MRDIASGIAAAAAAEDSRVAVRASNNEKNDLSAEGACLGVGYK
jgi:hypothetical protein